MYIDYLKIKKKPYTQSQKKPPDGVKMRNSHEPGGNYGHLQSHLMLIVYKILRVKILLLLKISSLVMD